MARLPTSVTTQVNGARTLSQFRGTPAVFQQTDDRQVNDAQRQQQEAIQPIKSLPFGNGNLIKGVAVPAGQETIVDHALGRAYQGYILLNAVGASSGGVYALASQPLPNLHIVFGNSGSDTTLDLWAY